MNDSHRLPDERMIALTRPSGWSGAAASESPTREQQFAEAEEQVVRPFMMTSGRTTPVVDGLRIETLVRATPAALSAPLRFELERVVRLCQRPHSIAEIGAALRVPIGVARVLVSDLVSAGHASVGGTDELSTAALERIRALVRNL
ncbi:DUF742 domain-containing protein [Nocardia seriolae]|uniref:DUF742 domain-containing protein n=1 Tax=Nocardia seriolae TaxID=37332 RepID=A0ABC9Z2C2_9NOCA|nr:DUF742 domain-containing protein [Nocardia seriolae]BEK98142.1 DUF742 domain-containing protein [Nocardia seriolae]GAM50129.1 hypothetical protein NS07_v2contig00138-0019 [Nocardia seriolae]GAP31889.1 hypothetical protein NSK11_contig00132-0002 [Nocardia seriolae]